MWRTVQDAFELQEPLDLGIEIEVTDVLEPAKAREVYAAARDERDRCALILDAGLEHILGNFDAAAQVQRALASFELENIPMAPADGIEKALAKLGKIADRDPMSVLHRIDGEMAMGIESDEDFELDLEELLADGSPEVVPTTDVAGFGLMLQAAPQRSSDIPSAIRQLSLRESRVVKLATTPARALIYLGFGGWNNCPSSHQQARTWEHWSQTIGGEPAVLRADSLEAIVARPITTRDRLAEMAREVIRYNRDSVIEGTLPLLAMLYRNASLHFWWD